jgi:NADP-reducing hydrogenase subunit HndB
MDDEAQQHLSGREEMNLEELKKIREKAKKEMEQRQHGVGVKRVIVGMGTCGIGAGARDVMAALLDELSKKGINNVEVTQTGCGGHCEYEPLITVVDERGQVMYGRVTPDDARAIVRSHLIAGNILGNLVFEPV